MLGGVRPNLFALALAATVCVSSHARAQAPPAAAPQLAEPRVEPAIDGILTAFLSHPIVVLGDAHVMAEEGALYAGLVRDPRFAKAVGNVVVEFGGSAHQDIVDRYVAGETVPYAELRRVWTDVVGWLPTVAWMEYIDFFAAVRAANLGLPADQRIHLWLGEPPIDWSKVHSKADLAALHLDRNQYPADLIKREILAKGKKALVIYGNGHFRSNNGVDERVEAEFPHSFFVISPYFGFNEQACDRALEKRAAAWPKPALVWPVRGTWLAGLLRKPGCTFEPALASGAPPLAPDLAARMKGFDELESGVTSDALLYVTEADRMTASPVDPAFYLDEDYFREISRRSEIMIGHPRDWSKFVTDAGRGVEPYQQHIGRQPAAP